MKDKFFYILDHKFLPTHENHLFFVKKFASGFALHGFTVKMVTSVKEINKPGFVMTSNCNLFYYFIMEAISGKSEHCAPILADILMGLN